MSCNQRAYGGGRKRPGYVSIPIGFSNELQLPVTDVIPRSDLVSIPIGFSNELQLITDIQPYYE